MGKKVLKLWSYRIREGNEHGEPNTKLTLSSVKNFFFFFFFCGTGV
jgi:hypothetical protein